MDNEKNKKDHLMIAEEFRRVSELSEKIDVSASVMQSIREMSEKREKIKPSPFRWSFALTLAGLFLILLISFTFFFMEDEYGSGRKNGKNEVRINSVRIDGQEAKQYHFHSENENRVVIWVQKYSEG